MRWTDRAISSCRKFEAACNVGGVQDVVTEGDGVHGPCADEQERPVREWTTVYRVGPSSQERGRPRSRHTLVALSPLAVLSAENPCK